MYTLTHTHTHTHTLGRNSEVSVPWYIYYAKALQRILLRICAFASVLVSVGNLMVNRAESFSACH